MFSFFIASRAKKGKKNSIHSLTYSSIYSLNNEFIIHITMDLTLYLHAKIEFLFSSHRKYNRRHKGKDASFLLINVHNIKENTFLSDLFIFSV